MPAFSRALSPSDAAAAAALHAAAFADAWSEDALRESLAASGAATRGWFDEDTLIAFALFQEIAGEAELLTVATHPARRGQGLARRLITALIEQLEGAGTRRFLLDVAEDNAPARHLYAALGFREDGRRKGYYTAGRSVPVDAILMSRPASA